MYLWNYVAVYKVDRIDRMKPSGLFRWSVRTLVGPGIDIDIDLALDIDIGMSIRQVLTPAGSQRFGRFRVQPMPE